MKEFMIDMASGKIACAVLSFGGLTGMDDKLFAVPRAALTLDTHGARLRCLRGSDAAEIRQHDRLPPLRITVEREDPPAWPAPVEQLIGLDLRAVALAQVLDIGAVVVDADDVGGAALPPLRWPLENAPKSWSTSATPMQAW